METGFDLEAMVVTSGIVKDENTRKTGSKRKLRGIAEKDREGRRKSRIERRNRTGLLCY
jgi:hypothetical protein